MNWDVASLNTLRQRLIDQTIDGLWFRERLMPRSIDGRALRPIHPPPGAPTPRSGAVLLVFYPHADAIFFPLTVRTTSLRTHSGEVSLPGGSADPADADLAHTALREAWEELAISSEAVGLWTALTPVWIPVSNFQITPYVGWTEDRPRFALSQGEVAELIEAPLERLLQPDVVQSEQRDIRGLPMHIPYFAIGAHKVWGATSMILAEVVGKLRFPDSD